MAKGNAKSKAQENKQRYDVVLPPYNVAEFSLRELGQIQDWGHKLLEADSAYAKTKGDGVIIFILDTAGEFVHEDLKDREIVAFRKNFSDAPTLADLHEHGSHCAGIAAATDNGIGVIGIAPAAMLGAVKVLNDQGSGTWGSVAAGLKYVADLKLTGPYANYKKVISMSLGGSQGSAELEGGVNYAIEKGCFVLAAAGNSGNSAKVGYPGAYEQVITVGSIGKQGNPSAFSSGGVEVDLAAPGEGVYSTGSTPGKYVYMSGTSMATPQVAGVVALILSANPEIKTQAHLEQFLEANAKDIYLPGEDLLTGAGLPLISKYMAADPGEPNDPTDPEEPEEPQPDPPVEREKRAVLLPFSFELMGELPPSLIWRRLSESAFHVVRVQEIVFEVTTRLPSEAVHDLFLKAFKDYATNRGYILLNNHDFQDAAEYVARFFVIIRKELKDYKIKSITVTDAEGRIVEVSDKLAQTVRESRITTATFIHDNDKPLFDGKE